MTNRLPNVHYCLGDTAPRLLTLGVKMSASTPRSSIGFPCRFMSSFQSSPSFKYVLSDMSESLLISSARSRLSLWLAGPGVLLDICSVDPIGVIQILEGPRLALIVYSLFLSLCLICPDGFGI